MRSLERRLDKAVHELGQQLADMPDDHPDAAALTTKFIKPSKHIKQRTVASW